jgi:hypothetical protein
MKKILMIAVGLMLILTPISSQAWMIGGYGNWPTVGLQVTKNIDFYAGFSNYNYGNGDESNNYYLLKADYLLAKVHDFQTKIGINYRAFEPRISHYIDLTLGASFMATKYVSVGGDIVLVSTGKNEYYYGDELLLFPTFFMSIQFYI